MKSVVIVIGTMLIPAAAMAGMDAAVGALSSMDATAAGDALGTTSNAVTGIAGGGILGVLWMFLRKIDGFFDAIQKHFTAEESALREIVAEVREYRKQREIDEKVYDRVRRDTGPISVVDR